MSTAEFQAFDHLPVGVVVARGPRVVYANAAACAAIGVPRDRLEGRASKEIADEILAADDRAWAHAMTDVFTRGGAIPGDMWVRLTPPRHEERSARLLFVDGKTPDEKVIVILDAEGETITRRLTEAMVLAANEFVRCRDEREVMEAAVAALHRQGYWVAVLVWNEGKLTLGAHRQDASMLQKIGEMAGVPAGEFAWDANKIPYLRALFENRRAVFTQDIYQVMDQAQTPDVAKMMRETMPQKISLVDAPIFIGDRPFGFLSVQGAQLSPGSAATIELFAQLLAGALENVEHHRNAQARLKELTQLQDELVSRERLAALGEAAGVLSHEARNPLGAILNAIAVLKRDARLGEDGRVVLGIAEEEALRLEWLVRDLMELARPLEPRSRATCLEAVLDAAVSDFKRRLGSSAPAFHVSSAASLPQVRADPTLLRVAVENLLRNAAQIAGNTHVRVSLGVEGDHVVFGVDDALPAEQRQAKDERFDPFSIVRPRGTGLGLAVVKRLAEAQGAAVRARNGGARIDILLPIARELDEA